MCHGARHCHFIPSSQADYNNLAPGFLFNNVVLALRARSSTPWAQAIPWQMFLDYVRDTHLQQCWKKPMRPCHGYDKSKLVNYQYNICCCHLYAVVLSSPVILNWIKPWETDSSTAACCHTSCGDGMYVCVQVLPYAQLDEPRDAWRPLFTRLFMPLVATARTSGEAAQVLFTSDYTRRQY